ncbi:MAG: hypothetical protein KIS90_04965 [Phenylobacterium sp.]|nr:hypothetical protein [Phenylobacterium sp.]
MLATMLRHDVEARLPEGTGRVAALFRLMQDDPRQALPEAHARRRFLRGALSGPAAEAAMAGDMEGAMSGCAPLRQPARFGRRAVHRRARGPADLLTLRAARAPLAAADVLVCDDAAHTDRSWALARRDAERRAPQSPAQLADPPPKAHRRAPHHRVGMAHGTGGADRRRRHDPGPAHRFRFEQDSVACPRGIHERRVRWARSGDAAGQLASHACMGPADKPRDDVREGGGLVAPARAL